jgi:hypothetical protein
MSENKNVSQRGLILSPRQVALSKAKDLVRGACGQLAEDTQLGMSQEKFALLVVKNHLGDDQLEALINLRNHGGSIHRGIALINRGVPAEALGELMEARLSLEDLGEATYLKLHQFWLAYSEGELEASSLAEMVRDMHERVIEALPWVKYVNQTLEILLQVQQSYTDVCTIDGAIEMLTMKVPPS